MKYCAGNIKTDRADRANKADKAAEVNKADKTNKAAEVNKACKTNRAAEANKNVKTYKLKKKCIIAASFTLIIVTVLCSFAYYSSWQFSDNVLRLHVIANSNTSEDQALKLKVRDKVGALISSLAEASCSADQTEKIVKENISTITECAQQEVYNEGFDYKVTVKTGKYYFPTKYYAAGALPAGDYEAVRIIIGSGEGDNWWCVLFPPLCFSGGSYVQSENGSDKKSEPVSIRFKIVEIFQEARHNIGELFQKIFK